MHRTATTSALLALLICAAPAFAGERAAATGTHNGEHRKELLEKFDANHDGKLDDGEKAAARAAFAAKLKEKRPELFAKIDTDGDGVLSAAELKAARAKLKERRQEHGKKGADAK